MTDRPLSGNRLAGENSPYLLQHADNPVDWYPWGEEALGLARAEDWPILLSIGYSACHWCHVMARESFEDGHTAALMNRLFVNIKVDREERPDLDRIYQGALNLLMGRQGGWPLTMFLDPRDLSPFFGGTYFPRVARHGMPALGDVLEQVASHFRSYRSELAAQGVALRDRMVELESGGTAGTPVSATVLDAARQQLGTAFDTRNGGFGGAPKFPHPPHLNRLLRHWAATRRRGAEDREALAMVDETLRRMSAGGIHDQLGGGFFRYAVDAQWLIPHFEKMLSDNALILPVYAEAAIVTERASHAATALATAEWMIREMQGSHGGFHAALDAESEGEEGRFYLWSREEVLALLDRDEYAVFAPRHGLDHGPNFGSLWHLHQQADLETIARTAGRPLAEAERLLEGARVRLLRVRERRTRPALDDKVLASWNGLAIAGLARAGRLLEQAELVDAARRAADFVQTHLWQDNRLQAVWRQGKSGFNAYLDDYAFLLHGHLELLQSSWRDADLRIAVALADGLLARFEDAAGGFRFTSHDHEALFHRPRDFGDDALPSGNAVAARALLRLGHLLGEPRYLNAAQRTIEAAWPHVSELAWAHNAMLDAVEEFLAPPHRVIIRGTASALQEWHRLCQTPHDPARMCVAIPSDAATPGALATCRAPSRGGRAWICRADACTPPVTTPAALRQALGEAV